MASTSNPPPKRHYNVPQDPTKPPGLSKLKSSIRQAKRLLSKDNITPDVRVATERRLASWEHELDEAEGREKERSNATRYHAVKFFERQKVLRKLKRAASALEKGKASQGDKKAAKEAARLTKQLDELRVDLNYILHYPNALKYVALFPSNVYIPRTPSSSSASAPASTSTSTTPLEDATTKDPDALRDRLRAEMVAAMADGRMSKEPETTLGEKGEDGEGKAVAPVIGLKRHRGGKGKRTEEGRDTGSGKKARVEETDDFFA